MCLKEVDLSARRKCQPDPEEREPKQSPCQPSHSQSTKDAWRSITEKERQECSPGNSVDCKTFFDWRRARISKPGWSNQQQKILLTKLYYTIQSVCLQFASGFYYSFANFNTTAHKLQWSPGKVVKWINIITLLQLFGTVCSADGTGGTFLGNGFTPFIKLNGKVPPFSQANWICGQKTVKNVTDEQNLIISHQNMKNCFCEIRDPNRSNFTLRQYPMQVFNSCAIVEDETFDAFKEGKKCIQVELEGKVAGSDFGNVSQQYYSFCIKNNTMEISPEGGSSHQLELTSIRCSVQYINFEMNLPINGSTGQVLPKETTNAEKVCNDSSKMVKGIFIGAGAVCVIFMCLLAIWHVVKQRRNKAPKKGRIDDEAAGHPGPAIGAKTRNSSSDKLLANQERIGCISAV